MTVNVSLNERVLQSYSRVLELTPSEKESSKRDTLEMYERLEAALAKRPRVYERQALVAAE